LGAVLCHQRNLDRINAVRGPDAESRASPLSHSIKVAVSWIITNE
jgi:hypothetical protein